MLPHRCFSSTFLTIIIYQSHHFENVTSSRTREINPFLIYRLTYSPEILYYSIFTAKNKKGIVAGLIFSNFPLFNESFTEAYEDSQVLLSEGTAYHRHTIPCLMIDTIGMDSAELGDERHMKPQYVYF